MITLDLSNISLLHFLIVAALLFVIGIIGVMINRHSIINLFMSIELILLAVNLNILSFASYLNDLAGQVLVLLVLTVAAAEIAIGLAILTLYYKNKRDISITELKEMHG